MKATKFIVLVGGILGILAFFLPIVTVHHRGETASVSAFQVVKGLDAVTDAVDASGHEADVALASAGSSAGEAKDGLAAAKGIVFALFVPALILSILGARGLSKKAFGRGAGAFALIMGLIGLGIGAMLKGAAEGDAGIGIYLLVLTGVLGTVGGLLALVKPERAQVLAAA